MKTTLLSSLFAAATTLAGVVSTTAPATAFAWNNSWTQPSIQGKSQTGFNDAPFQQFVQQERIAIPNSGQFLLDPTKLKLKYDHDVSVYFINEGASFRNQLAYEATGATNQSGLVFRDIASPEAIMRENSGPLKLGDGVQIGKILGGTQLDFWLRADGRDLRENGNIFGTQTRSNPDGLQHVVAYAFGKYLMLGFEDLYGDLWAKGGKNQNSDRDFNDVVFVVDIGEANVKDLTSVPEPSMLLGLLGLSAAGALGLRRQKGDSVTQSAPQE
ncbi:DUF4114 domain-containing protein [Leptolyngbya sp. FACHB-711]|uniref:DUF4114 domain-containing protein n=1 Tax=unclassified Leptolyngbya TaxID=2650499 RepID=UPI0016857C7C|nr:DUF4114 domain-containing protein [Leptolyngbya sp. FACHB-711]MBD1849957.1 DUF4114 domain-containing protein [Cyanobacteria bacterium FACHB-502]MBD2024837.1 DUF4114 domain-containing protein [Leptolyngbya sp. FACHB-711]